MRRNSKIILLTVEVWRDERNTVYFECTDEQQWMQQFRRLTGVGGLLGHVKTVIGDALARVAGDTI